MEKELLTVGEAADLMGTTVRTLQYYDKEGLLKPSVMSKGGRRLYTAKDIIRLHQILSFKYLGFSLAEIKGRLLSLDNPKEVADILKCQKETIEAQIAGLKKVLAAITLLHSEVLSSQKVDFSKYAEIIELLRKGDKSYWSWEYFDNEMKEHIQSRFRNNKQAGNEIFDTYEKLLEEALLLKREGEREDSEKSLRLAEKWWNMVMEFTGGDMSLLPKLEAFNDSKESWNNEFSEKQKEIDIYIKSALNNYFSQMKGK